MALVERTGSDNPFNQINGLAFSKPTFVDLDNDGDKDLVIGSIAQSLKYYRNDGNGQYTQLVGTGVNPVHSLYAITDFTSVAFSDLDRDGDLDAVVGAENGRLDYFRNDGVQNGVIQWLRTETNSPFRDYHLGGVEYGNSVPTFADFDQDGDQDAFVGSDVKGIVFLRNDSGTFNRINNASSPFYQWNQLHTNGNVSTVDLTTPTIGDLDGDGDLDAAIGSVTGHIFYLQNLSGAENS